MTSHLQWSLTAIVTLLVHTLLTAVPSVTAQIGVYPSDDGVFARFDLKGVVTPLAGPFTGAVFISAVESEALAACVAETTCVAYYKCASNA